MLQKQSRMPYTRTDSGVSGIQDVNMATDTLNHKKGLRESLKKEQEQLTLSLLKQMVTLTTSGFGLVAALAWNNVIQDLVNNYIKPYLPQGSSLFSLFLYAVIITSLAVLVTYNLTKVVKKLETINEEKYSPEVKKV